MDGFPIHEIVGEVLASRHPDHRRGRPRGGLGVRLRRPDGARGRRRQRAGALRPVADPRAGGRAAAAGLRSVRRSNSFRDLAGRHVAVIGQGSIGLLFSYVAKAVGARHVTGVDPIDRDDLGAAFGVDTVVRATSDRWVSHLAPHDQADIVIEAVGHQVATLEHAVEAAAPGGTVFYFGVPDDDSYPISMRTMLRNNLTLKSGVTLDRRRVLRASPTSSPASIRTCCPLRHAHLRRRRRAGGVRAGLPADAGARQDRDRGLRMTARAGCSRRWPTRPRCGAAG